LRMTKSRFAVLAMTAAIVVACGRREETPADVVPPQPEATTTAPKQWTGPSAGVPGWTLPDSAFKMQWEQCSVPGPMAPGSKQTVQVKIKNTGDTEWPDRAKADPKLKQGAFAVRLSYQWLLDNGRDYATTYGNLRADLPNPVKPGESVVVPIEITAPPTAGRYQLQFDLLQELVSWFGDKGAEKCIHPVVVR
jgi:Ig-like domain-containing protein